MRTGEGRGAGACSAKAGGAASSDRSRRRESRRLIRRWSLVARGGPDRGPNGGGPCHGRACRRNSPVAAAAAAAAPARGLDPLEIRADEAGARSRALGGAADTLAADADGLAGVLVQAGRHIERTDAQSRVLEAEMAGAAQDAARVVEAV